MRTTNEDLKETILFIKEKAKLLLALHLVYQKL